MNINQCFDNYTKSVAIFTSQENAQFNAMNAHVIVLCFSDMGINDTDQIKQDTMFTLIQRLQWRGNHSNSINKKIGTLKRAMKYNQIVRPGVTDFRKIRVDNIRFDCVTDDQMHEIQIYLSHLDLSNPIKLMQYITFNLFMYTGCRVNELLNIKVSNVDLKLCLIWLDKTKSREPRYVLFQESFRKVLRKYIDLLPREYLMWNFRTNSRYTALHVRHFFRQLKKVTQIDKLHPHMLRHSMATTLIDNGAPLESVRILLGHKSIATTQRYLHMQYSKVKADYTTYFPDIQKKG